MGYAKKLGGAPMSCPRRGSCELSHDLDLFWGLFGYYYGLSYEVVLWVERNKHIYAIFVVFLLVVLYQATYMQRGSDLHTTTLH